MGKKGELTIAAILAASAQERMLNRGHRQRLTRFDEFIAKWLKDLGIIESFAVKPVAEGRKEYEVLVKTHVSASEVKITDVGFGVTGFTCFGSGFLLSAEFNNLDGTTRDPLTSSGVEAELADVFISATQARENGKERHVQLIVESHSEHFSIACNCGSPKGSLRRRMLLCISPPDWCHYRTGAIKAEYVW